MAKEKEREGEGASERGASSGAGAGGEGRRIKRRAACLPVITRRDKVIPGHK